MADVPPLALTPDQCRRARELLGWDMLDLAEASGVRVTAIIRLEDGSRPPAEGRVGKVRGALEEAGVEFLEDGAARLREEPSAEEAILPRAASAAS